MQYLFLLVFVLQLFHFLRRIFFLNYKNALILLFLYFLQFTFPSFML